MTSQHILCALGLLSITITACRKDKDHFPSSRTTTVTIENVLDSRPLVQSGTFQGTGTPPLVLPGESVTIRFSAAKGEAVSFATMYGWSNDLFFAPENPGILVYDSSGLPIEGDVSSQVKLWDNGTRINQVPGASVAHPGEADRKNVTEVGAADAQGHPYLPASQLVNATLAYEGNSYFALTLRNISGGTQNETPLSPGVWAVSYIVGGGLLEPAPFYQKDQPTANGLTSIAEAGDNKPLSAYTDSLTGIFTPLSPIFVVIYNGVENPIYKIGEKDRGEGLTKLAQQGNAEPLAEMLKDNPGVKAVYVLRDVKTQVLLPMIDGKPGGKVSQEISISKGDRLAIATMYGFSNDWFFASKGNGVDPFEKGDISSSIALYNDGTAIDQFPGAGITQFNLAGTPLAESMPIAAVPNPNPFTTLPAIDKMIRVKIE